MYSTVTRTTACVSLILTFIVGMIGNSLVCVAVYTRKSMRTPTNLILVNLAAADLLGCIINMPIMFATFITDFRHIEVLGDIHFVLTSFIGIAICSCHILLCIDRYDAIKTSTHRRITRIHMKRISKILWAVSVGAAAVMTVVVIVVPTHWLMLRENQPHFIAGEVLNGFGTAAILSILFSMIYSCYVVKRGVAAHNAQMVQSLGRATLEQEIKINKLATCLVLGFTVTCLPWIIVRLLYSITGHQGKTSYVISYTLLYTSHAINPVVYAGFMKTFQKAMIQDTSVFLSKVCCGRSFCVNVIGPLDATLGNTCQYPENQSRISQNTKQQGTGS